MLNDRLILAKSIALLYREAQIPNSSENSAELVRNAVNDIKVSDIGIGMSGEREIIVGLKNTVLEMCGNPHDYDYDLAVLLQRIKINCSDDDKLYKAIAQGIEPELAERSIKKTVGNLRRTLSNHFREKKIFDELGKSYHKLKFDRDSVGDINDFIDTLITRLDNYRVVNEGVDPAVMDSVDVGDDEGMHRLFNEAQNIENGDKIYKTGWQAINEMCQGGFRRGECVVIGALQHKYKTGFTLSLFAQLAMFNKPMTEDTTKKPLLLRISFEDPLVNNLQFLYQYLKYNETKERVSIKNVSVDEMSNYVKAKLQVNGFHIKMIRVDPNQWSFRALFDKILELEAQGYAVEVLMVDYLSQINKTGCVSSGIAGSEIGDLLSRTRNFCSSRGTLFITPHQCSTDAKGLIRGGVSEDQFVKEIAEKGYWENNRGLDRIFDLGLLIHLFKRGGDTFFTVQRDKHRISSIVDDDSKYAIWKFPKFMPIPHDIDGECISFRKMSRVASNVKSEIFDL